MADPLGLNDKDTNENQLFHSTTLHCNVSPKNVQMKTHKFQHKISMILFVLRFSSIHIILHKTILTFAISTNFPKIEKYSFHSIVMKTDFHLIFFYLFQCIKRVIFK